MIVQRNILLENKMIIADKKHLVYVPARLGSTRLHKKALKDFGGEPLILRCMKKLRHLSQADVYLNTESREISEAVIEHLPDTLLHKRPGQFSKDETTTEEILQDFLSNKAGYEYVSVINPTSPLLSIETITRFLNEVALLKSNTAFSVTKIQKHIIFGNKAMNYDPSGPHPRTQDVSPVYMLNWSIVTWSFREAKEHFKQRGDSLYLGKVDFICTPDDESVDIDTQEDWNLATILAQAQEPRVLSYATL